MARKVHAPAHPLENEFVNIENFGKLRCYGFQPMFEFGVADHLFRLFDGCRLALDMRKDVGNFWDIAAHVRFEFGHLIVRILEGHALIEFDVLFDVQLAGEILNTDVVDVKVPVCGHGANAIEDILRTLRARQAAAR